MKMTDLKEKTTEELRHMVAELAEQIRALETGVRTATFKQTHEIAQLKQTRARALTILSERASV